MIFGTAIPQHYYDALSERMLSNGFFARTLIVESLPRGTGRAAKIINPPQSILDTAAWWTDSRRNAGNLENVHPTPRIVPYSAAAEQLLDDTRAMADAEYSIAEGANDGVGTTVWARVAENVSKLALIYAVSADHNNPTIDVTAVKWASEFMSHQTKRMLFMARAHVADTPFHANCLKLMQKLRDAPDETLAHSVLLKRMKIDARTFTEIVGTLEQRGDLEVVAVARAGTALRSYRLRGET